MITWHVGLASRNKARSTGTATLSHAKIRCRGEGEKRGPEREEVVEVPSARPGRGCPLLHLLTIS
jgi:hypothetical protein